ncbi:MULTISPECIES: 4-hydroxythreonine-4-phosphate dehydrogenase PdxA [Enterococcus]|uniref:4-hydroxythreonine-4-phosphate dehydrogenase n=1 Tax=Enterococcus malodoratus ATCC 43197 TaxID=1158601 RepID=R2NT69_9ENTE|nr:MULTISPECIES: 4-hydroxythreonine-4-phosphate dehydrogenase PdxA [Enterococcus]EOH75242.1 4-hydroxythreonine-4-phosphate dehydrogenase [Enterococcus malodoratus ATCC 43197]EOT66704.1 4-hydroxythreonine-4-phosphate dehydrogenase [Enterococcus malodoratus ATCC 43197]OJG66001.1 4-hydroxythreonine-4-phosphate dehydrogenase [Enterococcus malodoratus]SPW90726.1 4-hydroxythreonine-4-phosphate dehydrogenase 2 [Enterococcus malodoratus]STD70043.1 4-hydroxythreonine-4-phosphate dehydrogenase 2 [Entero
MKKIIGITMGDPAGIGPEIAIKALNKAALYDRCKPLLIGDKSVLNHYLEKHPDLNLTVNVVNKPSEGKYTFGTIDLVDLGIVDMQNLPIGEVSKVGGNAAFQYVKKVIELALAKEVDATVTNPLNKEAMNAAGHHYAGHTEIYADLTGTEKYTMMLADGNLRVVHVSTHVSLREACDRATKERVLDVIRIADQACKNLGIKEPRIAVAGLNPHCGENGLFGQEEITEINPAVEAAQAEGINAYGSLPADTVFSKANGGMYDIVVAMYHDQGHIPLKTLGFVYDQKSGAWEAVKGVNITLGLPIIRTSVDHGTAFDQVGKWTASEFSLENAIDYAIRLAENV